MEWLSSPTETAAALPAVWLIATAMRPATLQERSLLRRSVGRQVVAHRLGLDPDAVEIGHEPGGRPLARPAESRLHLSLATRAGLVAVALAARPVGVDVEQVDPAAEPPLAALHPTERAALSALSPEARARAFARLWSVKEAYVKALGTGFARPPESFSVTGCDDPHPSIADPGGPAIALAATTLVKSGGQEDLAAAVVVLA